MNIIWREHAGITLIRVLDNLHAAGVSVEPCKCSESLVISFGQSLSLSSRISSARSIWAEPQELPANQSFFDCNPQSGGQLKDMVSDPDVSGGLLLQLHDPVTSRSFPANTSSLVVIMPPSPVVIAFLGWKLKQPASPKVPTCWCLYFEPNPQAASSRTRSPYLFASLRIESISAGRPNR